MSLEATNAIPFNAMTLDLVTKANFDTTYDIAEGRGCPGADPMQVPRVAELDENNNKADDCEIKWMRNFSALFVERKLNAEGDPTQDNTGLKIAAASAHLITGSHFVKDPDDQIGTQNGENGDDDELHEAIKNRWTKELGTHLRSNYPGADVTIVGGDFNIHRCDNKNSVGQEALDYPIGEDCERQDWWSNMISPRAPRVPPGPPNPDFQGFHDAVHQIHSPAGNDRLATQYRDGCDVLDVDGSCLDPHERFRRIDFLFGALKDVISSSHDLTCGEAPTGDETIPPTCDYLKNRHRYSDHRLVWALIGDE